MSSTIRLSVLYFAVFRERIGKNEDELQLPAPATVADAISALEERHDAVLALRSSYRIAVNQEMVDANHALANGDELVLIPPVAGGIGRHCEILDEALSLDRVVAAVSGPGMGGITTFTGQVRDFNDGHRVTRLEYEAYADMAKKVMHRLCDEIEAEVPGSVLAVEHRVGVLSIGEVAVVIAAAAPHRAEAFRACRALIDRLKEHVPIWKKEVAPDGAESIGLGP